MGVVELVPGVSGGTMALVLGIYGELINAIDATFAWIGRRLHRLLPGRYGSAVRGNAPPISFLALLVAGMAVALLAGSHVVTALLDTARGPTYAFFCGLVLASVATPLRLMERRGPAEVAVILCAAAASFLATDLRAAEAGTPTLPFLLVCGALAVAVLVLPGVSGSFVLLALGSYRYVIGRVRGLTAADLIPRHGLDHTAPQCRQELLVARQVAEIDHLGLVGGRGMHVGPIHEHGGGVGCGDHVVGRSVGHDRSARRNHPRTRREPPLRVHESRDLEQTSLARGGPQHTHAHILGQRAVRREALGVLRAHEQRLPKRDVSRGEGDDRLPSRVQGP
jgi:uncharacterized membrane protein